MKTESGQCAAAYEVSRERPFAVRRSKGSEPGRPGIEDAYIQSATYPARVLPGPPDARSPGAGRTSGAPAPDDPAEDLVATVARRY